MQPITAVTDPTIPYHVLEAAEFYAAHHAEYWRSLRVLREWTADNGPIRLASGKTVANYADGFTWDDAAVAQAAPSLVFDMRAEIVGQKADVERGLDVALEEIPALTIGEIHYGIDRAALTGAMRTPGALKDALEKCREPKSKLGMR